MTTDLLRFTRMAGSKPKKRFSSLMGLLFRKEGLDASFGRLAANKAPGVDGIRKEKYQVDLQENIEDLSGRLRRLGYRPQPSRRVYIRKISGGWRPLGIPAFEDRIVQDRVSAILQAIWEPEFRDSSYGFRPGRSAHDALRQVAKNITHGRVSYVVEADIKGFFDNVSHEWMMRFLAHRIADPRLLRIMKRFLKAGIMEDGAFAATEEGTPQGGLVSPVLANIYLHYVLDLWFEGRFAKTCRGEAHLVRYADDFVASFQRESDAKRYLGELSKRLAEFSLEVEPTKTRMLTFGRFAQSYCHREGRKRPGTFNFLGITHYVGTSRTGRFVVGRKTEGRRVAKKLREYKQKLRSLRVQGGAAMRKYTQQHLRGHFQYYGVSGNSAGIYKYYHLVCKILFKWLNRRSQRSSLTWCKYETLLKSGLLPTPMIHHNLYPVPARMT